MVMLIPDSHDIVTGYSSIPMCSRLGYDQTDIWMLIYLAKGGGRSYGHAHHTLG